MMRVSLFQAVGQLLLTLACAGLSSTPSLDICAAHHSIGEAYATPLPRPRARGPPLIEGGLPAAVACF